MRTANEHESKRHLTAFKEREENMRYNTDSLYSLSTAWGCNVFDIEDDIYFGRDHKIHIGSCEEEVFGTSKACEGYDERNVDSFDDIVKYMDMFDGISHYNTNPFTLSKEVNREEFYGLLKKKYEEVCRAQ